MSQDLRRITRRVGLALGLALLLAAAFEATGWAADRSSGSRAQASFSVTLTPRDCTSESVGGSYRLTGEMRREVEGDLIFSDGFESGDLSAWGQDPLLPVNTVLFFNGQTCPAGWALMAMPRFFVGLPAGGQLGGTVFNPLGDLFPPIHDHVFGGAFQLTATAWHYHWWSVLSTGGVWTSYHANNTVNTLFDWDNGIDSEGEGIYPFAADLGSHFETSVDQLHSHSVSLSETTLGYQDTLPYIQLLVCQKAVNRSK